MAYNNAVSAATLEQVMQCRNVCAQYWLTKKNTLDDDEGCDDPERHHCERKLLKYGLKPGVEWFKTHGSVRWRRLADGQPEETPLIGCLLLIAVLVMVYFLFRRFSAAPKPRSRGLRGIRKKPSTFPLRPATFPPGSIEIDDAEMLS